MIISSFPDADSARQIGTLLLEKQLAACVTLLPAARSMYRWQGKIEQSEETIAHIKSSRTHFSQVERCIAQHHPYEVPEIIALPITEIADSYRNWMIASLAPV